MGASPCSEDGFKHFDGLLDSVGVDMFSCPVYVHNMTIECMIELYNRCIVLVLSWSIVIPVKISSNN